MELLSEVKLQYAASGEPVTDSIPEMLEDKLVGLFFSASWCPATVKFLDTLTRFHQSMLQRSGQLVLVCVPFDRTEDDMRRFYRDTPRDWLTIGLADQASIRHLQHKYNVTAVPRLVILTDEGHLLTNTGRREIQDKGITAYRMWYNKFRPPGTPRRKLRAAVIAVVALQGMTGDAQLNTDDDDSCRVRAS